MTPALQPPGPGPRARARRRSCISDLGGQGGPHRRSDSKYSLTSSARAGPRRGRGPPTGPTPPPRRPGDRPQAAAAPSSAVRRWARQPLLPRPKASGPSPAALPSRQAVEGLPRGRVQGRMAADRTHTQRRNTDSRGDSPSWTTGGERKGRELWEICMLAQKSRDLETARDFGFKVIGLPSPSLGSEAVRGAGVGSVRSERAWRRRRDALSAERRLRAGLPEGSSFTPSPTPASCPPGPGSADKVQIGV